MSAKVLVVEDETKLRDLLRLYFEREGMLVLSTGLGAEAIALARDAAPDVMLLDLGLPDVRGEEVAQEVRGHSDIPIVVLTAKIGEQDRIRGLELGVDDYVSKPFSPREVVLRTRAVLRRGTRSFLESDGYALGEGELVIDEGRRELLVRGEAVNLTPTEWRLIRVLASAPGRVFSRLQLINQIRGYEFDGYERTVDSHVKNLRRKIEVEPTRPLIIETVLGAGYRMRLSPDD